MMRVYRSGYRYRRKRRLSRSIICFCIMVACIVAGLGTINAVNGQTGMAPLLSQKEKTASGFTQLTELLQSDSAKKVASSAIKSAFPQKQQKLASKVDKASAYDFDNAVFIGDSRTQALQTYGVMKNATYYAMKGLMVNTISTKPVVKLSDGRHVSVMDALKKKKFGKVYIMLGVNELGWNSSDKFIKTYGTVIDEIKKSQPGAEIYVQSILPVSAKKSAGDVVYNNTRINSYNQMIQKLAQEKSVYYLAVNKAIMDKDCALPKDASSDGVHPNKEYCQKWVSYLKENLADERTA